MAGRDGPESPGRPGDPGASGRRPARPAGRQHSLFLDGRARHHRGEESTRGRRGALGRAGAGERRAREGGARQGRVPREHEPRAEDAPHRDPRCRRAAPGGRPRAPQRSPAQEPRFPREAGRHLLSLLSDILDLARIGAERLSLSADACSLGEVCESALAIVREEAKRKGIALGVPWSGRSGPVRRRRPAGPPGPREPPLQRGQVHAARRRRGARRRRATRKPGQVRLEVRDTGPGIAPEDLPKLFQPFTQLDTRLAREHAGTGLGLALVRSLAELHGGRADVESEPGKGSRFRVVLPWRRPVRRGSGVPRRCARTGSRPSLAGPGPESSSSRTTTRTGRSSAEFLRMRGFSVDEASSGPEALALASSSPHDLVVLDIQLPGMDGLEVLARLRATGEPRPARPRPHRARHGRGPGEDPRRGCGRLPLQARSPRRPRQGDRPAAGERGRP